MAAAVLDSLRPPSARIPPHSGTNLRTLLRIVLYRDAQCAMWYGRSGCCAVVLRDGMHCVWSYERRWY
eukprot:1413552-Rhodomonas_salina.1